MDRFATLKKVAIWLSATIAAAILGAVVKTAYDRASPRIVVVQIRPSLASNSLFETTIKEIAVSDSLKKSAEKTLWSDIGGFRQQFSAYKPLVEALDKNETKMTTLLNSIMSFERDKVRIRELLRRGNAISDDEVNELFDLWERNDSYIYGSLRGKFRRGSFGLIEQKYDGPKRLIVRQNDDKDWVVARVGGRFGSSLVKQSASDGALQEEIVKSIAYMKYDRLLTYVKLVEEDSGDVEIARQLLLEIEAARVQISRISVTLEISNSGGTAISFLPYAELLVETEGVIQDGKRIEGRTPIQLEYRAGTPPEPTAIQIPPHSSQLFKFSSRQFVKDIPNTQSLLKILELGTSKCKLRLIATGSDMFAKKEYVSEPVTFAKLEPDLLKAK